MKLCLDGNFTDSERRGALFQGDLLLYSQRPALEALCNHAGGLIEETFGADPERAQFSMDVETFVAKAGPLKSRFTNDLSTKNLVRAVLEEAMALPTDKRPAYLDNKCVNDAELRREVDSLLRSHEQAGDER